jgi:hypothetical protein
VFDFGDPDQRAWTVTFANAVAPRAVSINGRRVPASAWVWDDATRTLTVHTPSQSTRQRLTISYR